jgi:hypothetical protein
LSNPHEDLPEDSKLLAQVIVNNIILVQSVPVENDAHHSWEMKLDYKM